MDLNMSLKVSILGAGFIGINLAKGFLKSGYHVDILDRGEKPKELSHENLTWFQGNVDKKSDVEQVLIKSFAVFYLVSSTVPGDKVDVSKELFCNVSQLVQVMDLCEVYNVERFIFLSSSSVYGVQEKCPINENVCPAPISAHGIQKLTMEYYISLFARKSNTKCKIVRLSNPYGPGQNIHGRQGFISIVIGHLTNNTSVIIRGTGEDVRDYIYIDEVVNACHSILTTDTKEVIFNLGCGTGVSLLNVINEFEAILNTPLNIIHQECRASDIPINILDVSKTKEILNFEASVSLTDGINMFLKHHEFI